MTKKFFTFEIIEEMFAIAEMPGLSHLFSELIDISEEVSEHTPKDAEEAILKKMKSRLFLEAVDAHISGILASQKYINSMFDDLKIYDSVLVAMRNKGLIDE